jgi:hypothetical protein
MIGELKRYFSRALPSTLSSRSTDDSAPPAESDREPYEKLLAERDGYKRAYEITATDLGLMRSTAAPWVRPDGQPIPDGPSIFVVTLPKSGTVYIGQSLRLSLGYDFTNTMVTPTPFKNLVWPTMAWDFQRGGMISVSHMQSDSANITSIKRAGITKGVINIRDPRAAMHSWQHFQYTTAESLANSPLKDASTFNRRAFLASSNEEQIDTLIGSYFKSAVAWIDAWVTVLDSDKELDFLLLSHDLLASDETRYFAEIMRHYNIHHTVAPVGRSRQTHFRSGSNTEWRRSFTPAQIETVNAMIPDRLWDRFNWPK